MKLRRYILLLSLALLSFFNLYSQEENFKELVIDKYISELKLNDNAQKKITSILLKYKPLFEKVPISNRDYNVLLKKEILEVYDILERSQFSDYKEIKKIIEPHKIYRTKG